MDKSLKTEQETQAKYSGGTYSAATISRSVKPNARSYFDVLLYRKYEVARKYGQGKKVLDLCCATGEMLMDLALDIGTGTGVDFSKPFILKAKRASRLRKFSNLNFIEGNARALPLPEESFDLVYCYSSLYYIPNVDEVLREVVRVLRPGGFAVLEFGNQWSLNTVVCRACPELAEPCHSSVREMRWRLKSVKLEVRQHFAFQVLPLWGNRPAWLLPLLLPAWNVILEFKIGGKMIDEWLCCLPGFRQIAFRHIFVCKKN